MENMQGKQVFSGKEGELWLDGEKMAETTKFRAEVLFEYSDVEVNKHFMKDRKLTGGDSDGEVTFHKVSSKMINKLHEHVQNRTMPLFTIISKLDDKDTVGQERIACYNCSFDKMILADWENGSLGKESYKFKFTDYELLDVTA